MLTRTIHLNSLVEASHFSTGVCNKKEDSPEQDLWAGHGSIYPVPIMPLSQFVSATPNFLVLTTEGNWLLQEPEADGMPAHKLPIESKSKDITGAFPLSHAQTYVWE